MLKKIGIGKIDNVTVMVDPNNTECNRGFAFVEFETINDAQVAYTKLQEKDVFGKNQKIKVAWAEPLRELDEEEMLKVCYVKSVDAINGKKLPLFVVMTSLRVEHFRFLVACVKCRKSFT